MSRDEAWEIAKSTASTKCIACKNGAWPVSFWRDTDGSFQIVHMNKGMDMVGCDASDVFEEFDKTWNTAAGGVTARLTELERKQEGK